jgi:hypothetical protein
MPYFVFKLSDGAKPDHIETFDVFRDAMRFCRQQRADIPEGESYAVKMVFAGDVKEARRLLGVKRKPTPLEEWEA